MRDFGEYRAMFLDHGVDPRAGDTMSLAEITSMLAALKKRRKPAEPVMSDDEFDALKDKVAAMNMPNVRLN